MSTKYPDLFAAFCAPFGAAEVRTRSGTGGKSFSYITARMAMNRLDSTVGPENWWDDYSPLDHSVICRLTLRLPDGSTVTKCDAGGNAGMQDMGDDDKSGFSDAFKRAAAKFGVGRYLYRDGVPDYGAGGEPTPSAQRQSAPPPDQSGMAYRPQQQPTQSQPPPSNPGSGGGGNLPTSGKALYAWALKQGEALGIGKGVVKFLDGWGQHNDLPERFSDWMPNAVADGAWAACQEFGLNSDQQPGPSSQPPTQQRAEPAQDVDSILNRTLRPDTMDIFGMLKDLEKLKSVSLMSGAREEMSRLGIVYARDMKPIAMKSGKTIERRTGGVKAFSDLDEDELAKMRSWAASQVGVTFATPKIAPGTHQEARGAVVGQQPGNAAPDLHGLRSRVYTACSEIAKIRIGIDEPSHAQAFEVMNETVADISPGEVIGRLRECGDADLLSRTAERAEHVLRTMTAPRLATVGREPGDDEDESTIPF